MTDSQTNDAEAWKIAKQIAGKIGYVPPSFSVAVRSLVTDQVKNNRQTKPVTKYQVSRLLDTPTFKMMLYSASKDLKREKLDPLTSVTVGTLMDFFEPFDIAAMICGFLFYRKLKKALSPESFAAIREQILTDSQIISHLGVAVPTVGVGAALLTSVLPVASLGTMILANEDNFKLYRRALRETKLECDLQKEEALWGCSSARVGIFLSSAMGFGVDIGNAYGLSLDPTIQPGSIKDPMQLRLTFARLWLNCLKAGQDQPLEKLPGEFYPTKANKEVLLTRLHEITLGMKHWLDCSKEDLTPQNAPQLFAKQAVNEEIPPELAAVFTIDEISSMDETAFDALVDQIDAEQAGKVPNGTVVLKSGELNELEGMVE